MDHISNLFISLKNAAQVSKSETELPYSGLSAKILEVLKNQGKIENFKVEGKRIKVFLAYKDKKPKMESVQKISRPGRKIYRSYQNFKDFKSGRGFLIVSTSSGVMTDMEARARKLGGEIIAKII